MATFIDTNILVYAVDRSDEHKNLIARTTLAEVGPSFVVSAQVLNEYYSAVTTKLKPPLPPSTASQTVRALAKGRVVGVDSELVIEAIDVSSRNKLSLWDSLIVSAAKRAGCTTLLSEDLNHGQVIEGVTVSNPFRQA